MKTGEEIISRAALASLLEYSTTLPTGTTPGKRWRCDVQARKRLGLEPEWVIGEYFVDAYTPPGQISIRWSWAMSAPGVVHRGRL